MLYLLCGGDLVVQRCRGHREATVPFVRRRHAFCGSLASAWVSARLTAQGLSRCLWRCSSLELQLLDL